jgi:tetratricopeptide (TPR) repeat protein
MVDKKELLERYQRTGDEALFVEARQLYERAAANGATAADLLDYGYLLECHARFELRKAVDQYERAIGIDPDNDKARYQLISARAGLREPELPIAHYEKELAESPGDIRQYRFLATAYVVAHEYHRAGEVIDRGLALEAEDRTLMDLRGQVRAGTGDTEGALRDWHRALELDTEDIGPLYSSAFLFEREGRIADAIKAWGSIVEWCEARGFEMDIEWPKREIERLETIGGIRR